LSVKFNIFADFDFGLFSQEQFDKLGQRINREDRNYLLNVNRTEYLIHLASEFEIDPLQLHFDKMSISSAEIMVPAERFPPDFNVHAGKSYAKQAVKYHIPFSGDQQLLHCVPNPRVLNTRLVSIEQEELCFEIIDLYSDSERIRRDAEPFINVIKQQAISLEKNVAQHNQQLRVQAESQVDARRAELLKQGNVLAALGVPVRRVGNVPKTFSVPVVSRKQITPKPTAPSEQYAPEPALDQGIYGEILQTIFDTGRIFERLPSTYADKDEETLRDHLILNLEPRFQISTTGETFNKNGKTDILMRYEGKNVFVAECKFWRGQKQNHETIDQLLSYLTWRDSKTAIVYFVDTKEMTAPLKAIEETTSNHACYIATKGKREESWFQFEFHLPGDSSRPVHVAILCFHLPKH
jgi:hypothetical protein